MEGIIIAQRRLKETSLVLTLLLENGELQKVKLPQVLRSKRRSSPFYYPATLWDVKFAGNPREYIVPRELNLIFSPIGIQPDYEELLLLQEALRFMKFLLPGNDHINIFYLLKEFIFFWGEANYSRKQLLCSHFHLRMLEESGYFSIGNFCYLCNKTVEHPRTETATNIGEKQKKKVISYHLGGGRVCEECKMAGHKENLIDIDPNIVSLKRDDGHFTEEMSSRDFQYLKRMREKIFKYLENI